MTLNTRAAFVFIALNTLSIPDPAIYGSIKIILPEYIYGRGFGTESFLHSYKHIGDILPGILAI